MTEPKRIGREDGDLSKRLRDAEDAVAAAKARLRVAEEDLQYVRSLIHRRPEEAE